MSDPVTSIKINTEGVVLSTDLVGNYDVFFDDQHVWSFAAAERPIGEDGIRRIAWPRAMNNWLKGVSLISMRSGDSLLHTEEVRFTDDDVRTEFKDDHGIPVMVDKWGLIQRPFSGRDPAVVIQMLDVTEQIIKILNDECGVQCWLAFGSLLGAAREGGVISFDSDVDLAYLSQKQSPMELNLEMYDIARALRRHGLQVLMKSGAFVTVLFDAPDGAEGSVDVYTTFILDGNLYETATVRTPIPASEILPLKKVPFEGRELPVPQNVDLLLEASYGSGWRVPDPSFRHLPGPDITHRFDPWFGSLMKGRRDWERYIRRRTDEEVDQITDFFTWVQSRISSDAEVLDLGAGLGHNTLAFARSGHAVVAADYARFTPRRAANKVEAEGLDVHFFKMNLRSLRDTISGLSRVLEWQRGPKALFVTGLIEALDRDARWNFRLFLKHYGNPGDQIFLEFPPGELAEHDPWKGGVRHEVETAEVHAWLREAGAVIEQSVPGGVAIDGRPAHRIQARYAHRRDS